jgi:hypothetical protein
MNKAFLQSDFKYKSANDLIRLGKDHDGGYLVSETDVCSSDAIIGLGINDDWSFESDFIKKNNVPLYAYDGSISKSIFLRNALKLLTRIDKPKLFYRALKTFISYLKFFSGTKKHYELFVGFDSNDKNISLDKIFNDSKHSNIFLKIDIEGSEYRILNSIINNQDRISGLAIEFHDVDLNFDKIIAFSKSLSMNIVHIHANNYAPLVLPENRPLESALLPHPLDMPNNRNNSEIQLVFDA